MTSQAGRWSRAELLVVFRLYCRTPFGRLHRRNPEIVALAQRIGRTPDAVAMKACNFASLDPQLRERRISGFGNASRADRALWEEFAADSAAVALAAESAFAELTGLEDETTVPELGPAGQSAPRGRPTKPRERVSKPPPPVGPTEAEALVRVRRVQRFFRAAVLAAYGGRCALTNLAIPNLLNASHIIPWHADEKRRADPRNGICLNVLHDRAFDRGLISFDDELRIIVSDRLREAEGELCELHRDHLLGLAGKKLRLPDRFLPDAAAIAYHRRKVHG